MKELTNGSALIATGREGFGKFWGSMQERGMQSLTPIEVVPVIGTIYLGYNAAQTCLGRQH
jgi:hypothetical protein